MRKIAFRGYCLIGCGKPVFSRSPKAKYCSAACAKRRFEHLRPHCARCSKKLKRHQRKYCSQTCQRTREFELLAAQLERGEYTVYYTNKFIRRWLIRRLGEACTRCGWAERHPKTGRVPIEVEHIDGDYANNRPENLTLLCPNCHSLTSTFRGLNRGRGRPHRLGGRANPLPRAPVSQDSEPEQRK